MDSTGRRRRRVVAAALAVVVAAALALRFVGLGDRVFHWDEARVGYWILQYRATGEWEYRAFVHGPFLFHVNEALFGVFGNSDAAARAPVALVGGLLPGVAWLFRTRLDDTEVLALAGILALNPVLVYYSRFMRNDVLVAAFSLAALGFAVRAYDTGRRRNLLAAGGMLALAFTTKENALVYLGMFVGAAALLFDARLFTARVEGESWRSRTVGYASWAVRGLWDWRRTLVGSLVVFLAVFVAFYAPRPALYDALANPTELPAALGAGTVGAANELWGVWGISGSASRDHSYVAFLREAVATMGSAALVVCVAGVFGFLAERYVADDPRDLVLFAGYWAAASVVVYPAITDIAGVWSVTHAVVPLTIPAAVGIALVVGKGRSALASDDRVGVALAAVVLFAVVAQMGVVTAETSFVMPQDDDNDLVQFGQPASDMTETLATVESVSTAHDDGTDVVFFGDHFYVAQDYDPSDPASVAGTDWFNRLPLNWYLERGGATVDSTRTTTALTACGGDAAPDGSDICDAPVVVMRVSHYDDLAPSLTERGYESRTYELTSTNTVIVVFVDTDAPGYQPH
ncbi:flippase activity-associated protein Agl23 [Halobacterium rubrum]|uniref:flippase activity-associated protein Agl23 n=1 Tax=Halobacterium TaxID=2239 RepID=UPI001F346043|nr:MULTISPECIES: flippase activity-associated protein Agl23 [Halobacterium]MDH5020800.1 TIGR03663 family protein [Halobacterium rubrum]